MATSQNGWPALPSGSHSLHLWNVPAKNGTIQVTLRNGSAGFLLVHFLLWWAETIEPLAGKVADDWGWAWRPIRGQDSGLSNHASGTATDANATRHPLGTHTLTTVEKGKIWLRLKIYSGVLRCGAFYSGRVDEMHTEVNAPLAAAEKAARRLMNTPRGRRVLEANPGQRRVILS